jgi:hypothetical protein
MEISSLGGHSDHPASNLFGMDSILYFFRQDLQDEHIFLDRIYRMNRIFFLQRFPEESAETQSA